jgi:hypothetical protein
MWGGGGGGIAGSQPTSTAVHRSPNKLWRFNSIFNLCVDDSSLNLRPDPLRQNDLMLGKLWGTVDAKQLCINYTYKLCQASLADLAESTLLCPGSGHIGQGFDIQGTPCPRDTSTEGRLDRGTARPRNASSKGRNNEDFSIEDTPVGDEITLHQNCPFPMELLVKKRKGSPAIFDSDKSKSQDDSACMGFLLFDILIWWCWH